MRASISAGWYLLSIIVLSIALVCATQSPAALWLSMSPTPYARPAWVAGATTWGERACARLYRAPDLRSGTPVLAPSPSLPVPSQTRAIVLLAVAGFASQAMVRCADTLLPQIASDFGVTVGAASIVVSTYAVMHGLMQLVSGPVGDRLGKYRMIAIATALCAVLV